ncbi:head decoration protein [Xanthomonas campestris]|uniref:head decoration protein n=2 Tax=Xanthomonas campestris TaxID=339 RepID=UPI0024B875AE|nr:head decoration protein [Xanthomonas campestris]WHO91848.1 head decoration protein [Xanthomonas campestris]
MYSAAARDQHLAGRRARGRNLAMTTTHSPRTNADLAAIVACDLTPDLQVALIRRGPISDQAPEQAIAYAASVRDACTAAVPGDDSLAAAYVAANTSLAEVERQLQSVSVLSMAFGLARDYDQQITVQEGELVNACPSPIEIHPTDEGVLMELYTNSVRNAEFLLSESNGQRSRELIVIPAGQGNLVAGTLLKADNTKAADGADAVKVLYGAVDASTEAVKATAIARDAEVHGELLSWASDTTADEKLLSVQSLQQAGITVRWTSLPIKSGAADQIEFVQVPVGGAAAASIGPIVAHIKDVFGALVNGSAASVTLTKTTSAGSLTGGGAKAAVNGVATWPAVSFSAAGTFTLTAASAGLTSDRRPPNFE